MGSSRRGFAAWLGILGISIVFHAGSAEEINSAYLRELPPNVASQLHADKVGKPPVLRTVGIGLPAEGTTPVAAHVDGSYFFLNGFGADGIYNIFRFDSSGTASPEAPVIGRLAGNAGTGIVHVAQPSAIQLSDRVRIFAIRNDGATWSDIAYWDSFDGGITFGPPTAAVTAASIGATHGLADPTIYVKGGDASPFKMLFGIRAASAVPEGITLAISTDAASWTVGGTVFAKGTDRWQAGGIVPSYVLQRANGDWIVAMHAYDATLATGVAAYATSSSPDGPFGPAKLMASPYTRQVGKLSGNAGASTGTTNLSSLRLNEPYIALQIGDPSALILTPISQSETTVTFDGPLPVSFFNASFAHVAAAAIDPSIIWETGGGWEGIFTAYKALSGTTCEYTVRMIAPSIDGPWTISSKAVAFQPYGPGNHHVNSTENPTPIVDASTIR